MEMWMWRKMTRTSCIEHKTNEEVLNEINEERTIMNTILKRTLKLIGHLLINNEFITVIMEGKIKGKRSRGRPRKSFFEEIFRQMGVTSYQNLNRTASDRHRFNANLRGGPSRSVLDVKFVYQLTASQITGWTVLNEETWSSHKYLYYNVAIDMGNLNVTSRGWALKKLSIQKLKEYLNDNNKHNDASEFMEVLKTVCDYQCRGETMHGGNIDPNIGGRRK
ncbi:Hypothetical protein CINCED_3A005950 [Cinara cedri]|uniref:Endonuclease/exonuclease/phosphatase n=1 Tax=Cinara cedri TaxID=506608 RepID=A0A5E4NMY8_9HEMI|nr:Hypothetical protein CINCED_3A005950 [Cinara cedri]